MGGNQRLDKCERYNILTNVWEEFAVLPSYRVAPSAVTLENRYIYLVGGFNYSQLFRREDQFINDILRVDTQEDELQWVILKI